MFFCICLSFCYWLTFTLCTIKFLCLYIGCSLASATPRLVFSLFLYKCIIPSWHFLPQDLLDSRDLCSLLYLRSTRPYKVSYVCCVCSEANMNLYFVALAMYTNSVMSPINILSVGVFLILHTIYCCAANKIVFDRGHIPYPANYSLGITQAASACVPVNMGTSKTGYFSCWVPGRKVSIAS